MKFSAVLSLFAATAVTACTDGTSWGDKLTALNAVNGLCHDSNEILAGNFAGLQSKRQCVNGNGKALWFTLQYVNDDEGRRIDGAECYDGFRKTIEDCETGDDHTYTNWRYVGNPEEGACP